MSLRPVHHLSLMTCRWDDPLRLHYHHFFVTCTTWAFWCNSECSLCCWLGLPSSHRRITQSSHICRDLSELRKVGSNSLWNGCNCCLWWFCWSSLHEVRGAETTNSQTHICWHWKSWPYQSYCSPRLISWGIHTTNKDWSRLPVKVYKLLALMLSKQSVTRSP